MIFFPRNFSLILAGCVPLHVLTFPKQIETAKLISGRIPLLKSILLKLYHFLPFAFKVAALKTNIQVTSSHILHYTYSHCLCSPSWYTSKSFDTFCCSLFLKSFVPYILIGVLSHCSSLSSDVSLPERSSLTTHQSDFTRDLMSHPIISLNF